MGVDFGEMCDDHIAASVRQARHLSTHLQEKNQDSYKFFKYFCYNKHIPCSENNETLNTERLKLEDFSKAALLQIDL